MRPLPLLPLPVEQQLHSVTRWADWFAKLERHRRSPEWTRTIRAHRRLLLASGFGEEEAEREMAKFFAAMKLEGFRRRWGAPELEHHRRPVRYGQPRDREETQ